ncbi:MAG TPA: hypothetical protein VEA61_02950 [Allosphingosinicella sp.]|nr:hypothetical protein [Allosphingosinicella sp.]
MTDTPSPPTFDDDIAPPLFEYAGPMAWRLDLTSYDDVKANAAIIYGQIQYGPSPGPGLPPAAPGMPPPPFPPFDQSYIDLFGQWIKNGCPKSASDSPPVAPLALGAQIEPQPRPSVRRKTG